jgi:hypothetical protein
MERVKVRQDNQAVKEHKQVNLRLSEQIINIPTNILITVNYQQNQHPIISP